MSEPDQADDSLPKTDITRRAILTLATAVAAFGTAMGATTASAVSFNFSKIEIDYKANKKSGNKTPRKNEGKLIKKLDPKTKR